MIIIEGPDCSGKTTLAARIEAEYQYLNFRRAPSLSSTEGADSAVCDWWLKELERPAWERMHGVYDRCFAISEPVYTPITDRVPNCSPEVLASMIVSLVEQKPTIIFCLPEWHEITHAMNRSVLKGKLQLEGLTESKHYLTWWAYFNQMVLWSGMLNTKTRTRVYQYDWQNRDEIDAVVRGYTETCGYPETPSIWR
jgi:hypothetical protein